MPNIKKDFFEDLLDKLNDGVYFLDKERRIISWNKGAEKIAGYTKNEVIEKRCSDNILIHVDEWGTNLCEDACPVKKTLSEGIVCEQKVYLHHKDGYRLPVFIRVIPILNKEKKIIGAAEVFTDNSPKLAMPQRILELDRMFLLDPLTNIGNRQYAEIHINSRLDEMHKYQLSFGVLFIVLDQFKEIREMHGRKIGGKVLKMVTQTLSKNLRFFDFVGRWDEKEFVVIIANMNEARLDFIANKLRLLVRASNITVEAELVGVTVSTGATIARLNDSGESLIERAQKLMEQSKKAGGDCVSIKLKT